MDDEARVRERLIARQVAIAPADGARCCGARCGERLEPEAGENACRADIPGIWNHERVRTVVQAAKANGLFCLSDIHRSRLTNVFAADATPSLGPRGRYNSGMGGHECHHCKQWISEGEAHDCWTTTEAALTDDLSEELKDAYERLRETAVEFGEQRIYASGTAIMLSRASCYFFVRPRRSFLQVCVFLGRAVRAPQVRRVERKSTSKLVNIIHI